MQPLRIIFAGSGEFGVPTLRDLIARGNHEIVQVVSQPDRPAGRGRKMHPTAVSQVARERGLPLVRTADINAENLPPADVLLVIAFGQKIATQIVDHPRLGSINLHASRLPKHRGAAPVNWAIINGEQITGNSVIRLANRMDAGSILGQSRLQIGELDTAGELHDRLAEDGVSLVDRVLSMLGSGDVTEIAQDDSLATLAPKLSREDSRLDWNRRADEIANQIRGMYPWPGIHVRLVDSRGVEVDRLTLVRARAVEAEPVPPGEIGDAGVGAGSGALQIVELQPAGKRVMLLDAYRRGHRWNAGMRLESIVGSA